MNVHEKIKHWEDHDCIQIMKSIGISKGASLIDFGCGFGHYTFPASKVVQEEGKVYAMDRNKGILKAIDNRIAEDKISNIITIYSNEKTSLDFPDAEIDCILFYDILHGEEIDRFSMIKESHRVLKENGIVSILPFHLTNFRDNSGRKKKYKIDMLIHEIEELGFQLIGTIENRGVHFEKYHSPHYIKNGGIEFEELELGSIYNFKKI
jgi:ubiquinone/menaquinone biosynthesis C-methylase UbiE